MALDSCKYSSKENYTIRTSMAVLGVTLSKREIKTIFSLSEEKFESLIEEGNTASEMFCIGAQYSFYVENLYQERKNISLHDLIIPLYCSWTKGGTLTHEDYKLMCERISSLSGKPQYELVNFGIMIGEYSEREKNIDLAIEIYKYTALLALELDISQRKHYFVRSVLKLSKLEFMRGISPDKTLELQRLAVEMINQSNLNAEDSLLMLYAGMGEHFGGVMEIGENLRSKGIKYLKQFDYADLEAEVLPLVGWHYYLQGDFKKTIAYYESFILAIENRQDDEIITFAYPPIIFSYFFIGEYSRALALAENIYMHALRDNDELAAILIHAIIGRIYVYMNKFDVAEKILNETFSEGEQSGYGWGMYYAIMGTCLLELKRENYLKCTEAIVISRNLAQKDKFAPIIASPFVLEALLKIKELGLEPIENFTYDDELKKYLSSNNIHLRGIANRHLALIKDKEGENEANVLSCLKTSVYCLETSGNVTELSRTYIEIARLYFERKDMSNAELFANRAWKFCPEEDKAAFPKKLKELINWEQDHKGLEIELETTWLELRNIINEERLETRMLTSLCRTFRTESGVFAIIRKSGIDLKLVQNLDKNNKKSVRVQRIEGIISQVAATGELFVHNNRNRSFDSEGDSLDREPAFCLAIPFKKSNQTIAILYLDSFFFEERIRLDQYELLLNFADRMGDTVFTALNYGKLTDKATSIEVGSDYGQEINRAQTYCVSLDDEVSFLIEQIAKVGKTNIPVLITGETGVGKEVFAREVYERSDYKKTFIKVNCGAIPESLIESELFGYEKGSFTGAAQRKKGYFELAEGGTIFLDEVGELSLIAQVKLLRVLQEHELMRVGGTESIKVDFRLIAATNKDLKEEVKNGTFRKDLFYRLNVVQLSVPPLRNRKKDIPNLANFFIEKYCREMNKPQCTVSPETLVNMLNYQWPGNVRELENTLQRAVLFAENNQIKLDFNNNKYIEEEESFKNKKNSIYNEERNVLEKSDRLSEAAAFELSNFFTLEEMEREYIKKVIEHCGGKISGKDGAASLLGLPRTTLISKMNKLGIR